MCKQSRHNHKRRREPETEKMKFYRHLRSFLFFNIAMFFLWMVGSGLAGLWAIAKIWGVFLVLHYLKARGIPGTRGWLSRDWQDWMQERESHRQRSDGWSDEEPERPQWREKDLV